VTKPSHLKQATAALAANSSAAKMPLTYAKTSPAI
jgi:hypothetical protein